MRCTYYVVAALGVAVIGLALSVDLGLQLPATKRAPVSIRSFRIGLSSSSNDEGAVTKESTAPIAHVDSATHTEVALTGHEEMQAMQPPLSAFTPQETTIQNSPPSPCARWNCTCEGFSDTFNTWPFHWGNVSRHQIVERRWWLDHKCDTSPSYRIVESTTYQPRAVVPVKPCRAQDDAEKASSASAVAPAPVWGGAAEIIAARRGGQRVDVCGNIITSEAEASATSSNVTTRPCVGKILVTGRGSEASPVPLCTWRDEVLGRNSDWINFTVAEARQLLRGKTVIVAGDSTSRRAMWALCKFLEQNSTHLEEESVSNGCCGTHRIRIWCSARSVAVDHDIMLLYDPPLEYPDVSSWLASDNPRYWRLADGVSARTQCGHTGSGYQRIWPRDMPPSLTPRAVHVFGPAAATWHVHPECYEMLPGRWGNGTVECAGAAEYVGSAPIHRTSPVTSKEGKTAELNTTDAAVCEITAAFCARFVGEAAALRQATALGHDTTALYGHGLSNVLAQPGVVPYYRLNEWQARVARALNPKTRPEMCGPFGLEKLQSEPSEGVYCGGVDQTSWMATPENVTVRHPCMPSDGWNGIHIMNDEAQFARVQLLLNAIWRAETSMPHASDAPISVA